VLSVRFYGEIGTGSRSPSGRRPGAGVRCALAVVHTFPLWRGGVDPGRLLRRPL